MKCRFMILAIAIYAASANAQALNDPMRPPQMMISVENEEGDQSGPVLQTIVIGQDRRYAIIDGQRVTLGTLVGEAKVVRIVENEVTLRDSAGDTVLKLYPELKKLIVTPRPPGRAAIQGERGKQ